MDYEKDNEALRAEVARLTNINNTYQRVFNKYAQDLAKRVLNMKLKKGDSEMEELHKISKGIYDLDLNTLTELDTVAPVGVPPAQVVHEAEVTADNVEVNNGDVTVTVPPVSGE